MVLLLGRHLVVASVAAVMKPVTLYFCVQLHAALEVDSSNAYLVPIVRNCVQTTVMSRVSEHGVLGRL